MTISSPSNPALKDLRKILMGKPPSPARSRLPAVDAPLFAAEGEDLVDAARAAGWPALAGYRAAGSDLGGAGFVDVEPDVLARVSLLGSGTRVIGVYEQRWAAAATGPLAVYLHGVRDPGNVGTVLRAAQAFGAAVVVGEGSADPYGARAVRASMGAIFTVPLSRSLERAPAARVALVARAGVPLRELEPGGPLTLMVGAEREGLPAELVASADAVAHIPMAAGDSLNAAMAATVALYELAHRMAP